MSTQYALSLDQPWPSIAPKAVPARLDAAGLRAAVLRVLEERGDLTADEVAGVLGESVLAIRPRVTELKQARYGALIVETGEHRPNLSGRPAAVVTLRRVRDAEAVA